MENQGNFFSFQRKNNGKPKEKFCFSHKMFWKAKENSKQREPMENQIEKLKIDHGHFFGFQRKTMENKGNNHGKPILFHKPILGDQLQNPI